MKFDDYLCECKQISKIISENKFRYEELMNETLEKIETQKYSFGGLYIHRGYFCPSRIVDIISNVSRGKYSTCKKRDYTYSFDKNGLLIMVKQGKITEFIQMEELFELGIAFCGKKDIQSVSKCEYYEDGRIKEYSYFICDSFKNKVIQMTKEKYEYTDQAIIVNYATFMQNKQYIRKSPILIEEQYSFEIINEHFLKYSYYQIYPKNPLSKMRYFEYTDKESLFERFI